MTFTLSGGVLTWKRTSVPTVVGILRSPSLHKQPFDHALGRSIHRLSGDYDGDVPQRFRYEFSCLCSGVFDVWWNAVLVSGLLTALPQHYLIEGV